MARVRSPNYPALSLPEAINSVAKVFAKENRHRADKEVVVKAMGYGGLNGASLSSLSALLKYGLLEQLKDGGCKVTDRALAILHPQTPQEKAEAIAAAARDPALFAEMLNDFPGSIPSDDNLRSYLVRKAFSPTALTGVIHSFRETMTLVGEVGSAYDSPSPVPEAPPSATPQGTPMSAAVAAVSPSPLVGQGAFQINVMTDRLILNGTLVYQETLEDLVRKLDALKAFLPKRPDPDETSSAD